MFSTKAEEIAKLLNDKDKKNDKKYKPDISTTQYRKFYEKILELNEKANGLNEKKFDIKILPFVKILNSKVEYSKERKFCGDNFATLMKESIEKIKSPEELQNFKYFLEAIIGYMPRR
jgi:CRISPR-associated protein Csm2